MYKRQGYIPVSTQFQPDILSVVVSSTNTLLSSDIESNFVFLKTDNKNIRSTYRLPESSFKTITARALGGKNYYYKRTQDNPLDINPELLSYSNPPESLIWQYSLVDLQLSARELLRAYVYRYACRFKWVDSKGIEHRSGFSNIISLLANRPIGEVGNTPSFNVNNLHLTNKPEGEVTIEVYRSENRLSTLHLIKEVPNNQDVEKTIIVDDILDRNLGQTAGPNNILISGAEFCTVYKGRYVLYGFPEKRNRVVVSSPVRNFTNQAIDFKNQSAAGDLVELLMDEDVTAVKAMDQYLLIFTTKRTYAWVVNEAGVQQRYPTEVSSLVDLSAKDSVSTHRTADGVMFLSDKGIWTVNRGLSPDFSGQDVQDFGGNVKAVTAVKNLN